MSTVRLRLAALLTALTVSGGLLVPGNVAAAGDPVALRFQVQPGGGPAGRPMPQQPIVRVVDADGNTVTTSRAAVTLKSYGDLNNVLVCQENPVRAINGVATFHGCYFFGGTESVMRIRATAYRLDGVISAPFDLGPPGPQPPVRLVFDVGDGINVGPFTATAKGQVWFDVRIRVEDPRAGLITSGPTSALPISLAMAPNPAGATISCSGGLTVPAIAGVATFSGCSISEPGIALHLVASADGADPEWSFAIDVWPPGALRGPRLELSDIVGSAITWGRPVAFRLHLDPTAAGQELGGRVVHIQLTDSPFDPDSWRTIGDATTDVSGTATFDRYRPAWNHYYRALLDGASDLGPAIGLLDRVVVRSRLVIRPTNDGGRPRVLAAGTTVIFTAIVRPIRPGTTPTKVLWEVRHFGNGRFTTSRPTSEPDADGIATLKVTFTRGGWVVRARTQPTPTNANSTPTYDQYIVR